MGSARVRRRRMLPCAGNGIRWVSWRRGVDGAVPAGVQVDRTVRRCSLRLLQFGRVGTKQAESRPQPVYADTGGVASRLEGASALAALAPVSQLPGVALLGERAAATTAGALDRA
jgi:hypothetical protein